MSTADTFTPSADELIGSNREFAAEFHGADLQAPPQRQLAIVACMDARIDPLEILGLANGEAHVIRNAGGVVTDDVIRSLCLSQRSLNTREIILVHHTACGLQSVDEQQFRDRLEMETGVKPPWSLEGFDDPYRDVTQSIQRLRRSPFLPHTEHIRGFVYDVADGILHEVGPDGARTGDP